MCGMRVQLLEPDLAMLDAAVSDPATLGRILDCVLADDWQVFPGALAATRAAVAANPAGVHWGTRLFLTENPRVLVGWGGFKGPPREGVVELGYAIAPAYRGRGLAGAAVEALVREAFAERDVAGIRAHTRAQPGPSVRVLERAGFVFDAEIPDPDDARAHVWRFHLSRPKTL